MMLKIKLFLIYKSVHAKILIITLAHVSLCLTAPSPEPTLPVHMDTDKGSNNGITVLIDFSLTVKAATLIFISGRGLAISSTNKGNQVLFIIW